MLDVYLKFVDYRSTMLSRLPMLTSLDGLDRAGRATGSAEPLSTLPGMGKPVQMHYRKFKSRLYILLMDMVDLFSCLSV